MVPPTFDPYLLIFSAPNTTGIVELQTDDKLFLGDNKFIELDDDELLMEKKKIIAKDTQILYSSYSLSFNGCKLVMENDKINFQPKRTGRLDKICYYGS